MTDAVLRYDENHLRNVLVALSSPARAAFAANCAERMLPVYRWFHRRTNRGDPAALAHALDEVWTSLGTQASTDLEAQRDVAESLVPEEDDSWVEDSAYAENAAAAVAYAVGTRLTGSVDEAVSAARQIYEALDYRVTNRDDVNLNEPGAERRIAADPLIQRELARQQNDLAVLRQAVAEEINAVATELRQRAQADGNIAFDFL